MNDLEKLLREKEKELFKNEGLNIMSFLKQAIQEGYALGRRSAMNKCFGESDESFERRVKETKK
jgi:hypothetical protein